MTDAAHTEPLLTVDDVAARCQVSTRTVRRWIKSGELQAIRLGRQLRVRPVDFESFLKKGLIW
jgi:excisionase family DNA binding protein